MARPLKPQTPLAERLIRARGAMRRSEAATRLKTHPVTLGAYERGAALPTAEVLIAMREVYDVSLDWLLAGVGEMRQRPAATPEVTPDRRRLRSALRAFADAVASHPAMLDRAPDDLADWIVRGYDWLGSLPGEGTDGEALRPPLKEA